MRGDLRFCDSLNKGKVFLWKICDKGGRGFKKISE